MPNFWYRTSSVVAVCVMAAGIAATGCGGGVKKVNVSGTVTYKGEKLTSGMLKFVGPEQSSASGLIKPDGTYTLTDVTPGDVKVAVIEIPGTVPPAGEKAQQVHQVALPDKFRDPEKSGVKYTITPSTTQLDIELK